MNAVTAAPLVLLRLEGAAEVVAAMLVYAHLGPSWWMFAGLFLVPDLSMLGYLKTPRLGAVVYNAAHTVLGPALLGAVALMAANGFLGALAAIWWAHIGFDRVLGYGLKYNSGFGDTHLGRLGRAKVAA